LTCYGEHLNCICSTGVDLALFLLALGTFLAFFISRFCREGVGRRGKHRKQEGNRENCSNHRDSIHIDDRIDRPQQLGLKVD
jgi:hypothetical protein